ncbi:unnamed protein product [Oncorhynchus mykiss]|uniref:E2F transcription factor CC-MB domain-containing protein n=1 Tax=Oncorhynchus mykiss TaxID=8022 RepID=A0A060WBK8_ONCMY|nr:unnamed protein product [Oncorhynchus mykiss]
MLIMRTSAAASKVIPSWWCVLPLVQNGQRKYQIHLISAAGPIDVLLINKDPVNSSPVVLPVPPPEEMLQNTKSAAASADTTINTPTHTFVKTTQSLATGKPKAHTAAKPSDNFSTEKSAPQPPSLDTRSLQSSALLDNNFTVFEPIKSDSSDCELEFNLSVCVHVVW